MAHVRPKQVFFVDSEARVRKAAQKALESNGYQVGCFSEGLQCIFQLQHEKCDILLTEMKLPDMGGMKLLKTAKRIMPSLPVVVLSRNGGIPQAVAAMQAGAANFLVKPVAKRKLLQIIEKTLAQAPPRQFRRPPENPLTKIELEILLAVLEGKTNKEIADMRRRAVRTIEDHRRRIMKKLNVHTHIGLVTKAIKLGLWRPENDS